MTLLTYEEVKRQIEEIKTDKRIATDYLRLFQEIFAAQYEIQEKLNPNDIYPLTQEKEAGEHSGLPLINPNKLNPDESVLTALLDKITGILENFTSVKETTARKFLSAARSGKINPGDMVRALTAGDADYLSVESKKIDSPIDEVIFITTTIARPFLRVLAESKRQKVNLENVFTDSCPICGGVPFMAKLQKDDGRRILECYLCDTQWVFKRLRCPFCGNEDHETLSYLFLDGDSCRIDKCDNCKRYIKTFDERKNTLDKPISLLVQDVATLHLDILATKEGYHR
jgi:FdhE protein